MTTNDDWIDGSGATFEQAFRGSEMLSEASTWLTAKSMRGFSSQPLFLFLSDTALQPDNRVTRYRKISKRINIDTFVGDSGGLIEEGCEECHDGLLFWSVIRVDPLRLPAIIDHLRSDRGSFLFFSRDIPKYSMGFFKILSRRCEGEPASIDQRAVVTDLIHDGLIPIRIWGPSGDQDIWVEIYTHSGST